MMQAIEDQFRFKPLVSLKKLLAKLFAGHAGGKTPVQGAVESAG